MRLSSNVTFFILLFTITFGHAKLKRAEKDNYPVLYPGKTSFPQLNSDNFAATIQFAPNFWLVEYYSSFCGGCKRFAPVWVSIADSVATWQPFVRAASIDCAEYSELCQKYNVTAFPTIRLYQPEVHGGQLGQHVSLEDSEQIEASPWVHKVLDMLSQMSSISNYHQMPKLKPFNNAAELIQFARRAKPTANHHLAMFERLGDPTQHYLGAQLILELSRHPSIYIGCIEVESMTGLDLERLPNLVHLDDDSGTSFVQIIPTHSGAGAQGFIKSVVSMFGLDPNKVRRFEFANPHPAGDFVPPRPEWNDHVYEEDIMLAISMSFHHEVGLHADISDEPLNALKDYVSALADLAALPAAEQKWLDSVDSKLQLEQHLTSSEWHDIIETNVGVAPTAEAFVHCRGSVAHTRGYPCGMWTLFHSLTVASALPEHATRHADPLPAIRGYMKYFFSCRECAHNFEETAAKLSRSLQTRTDGVLWLWEIHNDANMRLKGDTTEDAQFPKVFWPDQCKNCFKRGRPDETEILSYLSRFYAPTNRMRLPREATTTTLPGLVRAEDSRRDRVRQAEKNMVSRKREEKNRKRPTERVTVAKYRPTARPQALIPELARHRADATHQTTPATSFSQDVFSLLAVYALTVIIVYGCVRYWRYFRKQRSLKYL